MLHRFCFLLTAATLAAQQTPVPAEHTEVIVTGAYQPVPLTESDRSVRLFDVSTQPAPLLANSPLDFLRLDPSIDLRERAPNGLQSDISIRGGTFGQTLVLLNGFRLNSAQSGHHNLDVPVPLESLDRIEVLKGAGSTLYGSDAIGGVVNFVTHVPTSSEVRVRAALGSFGINQERLQASVARRDWSEQIAFSRDFSTGFRPDRDYRNLLFSSVTRYRTSLGATDVTLGYTDRPFGADQFYGNYPSWERTKSWFAGVRQALGERTEVSLAYRRHTDLFVLYRDRPELFTNRHEDDSWQAAARRFERLGRNTTLHYGVEGLHESVASTNLGEHSRSRGAGYAALDVRALRRFSFSAGAREEFFGGGRYEFSPSVTGGVWLNAQTKLRASASRAFRLPSYTDLYYHDPANLGSPNLRPETAWSYDAGLEWQPNRVLRGEATAFLRRESDGIDYVRASVNDIWRATNFQRLRFSGVEAALEWTMTRGQQWSARYTALHSWSDSPAAQFSKYSFFYPRHNGVLEYRAALGTSYALRTRVGALQRYGQDAYAVWDVYGTRTTGAIRPFLQVTNAMNTNYQEVLGVVASSRAIVGGVEWRVFGRQ